jgi:hypothetical protein
MAKIGCLLLLMHFADEVPAVDAMIIRQHKGWPIPKLEANNHA